jgi:hypothetical protein
MLRCCGSLPVALFGLGITVCRTIARRLERIEALRSDPRLSSHSRRGSDETHVGEEI